jgi:hypothetical protein
MRCWGSDNRLFLLVPGERLELSRYHYRWILSPLRLPFRHPGMGGEDVIIRIFRHWASQQQVIENERIEAIMPKPRQSGIMPPSAATVTLPLLHASNMLTLKAFKAEVLLLLAAIIWGIAFVAQRAGMDHVGPFTYNGARFLLGALSLAPLLWIQRRSGPFIHPGRERLDFAGRQPAGRVDSVHRRFTATGRHCPYHRGQGGIHHRSCMSLSYRYWACCGGSARPGVRGPAPC